MTLAPREQQLFTLLTTTSLEAKQIAHEMGLAEQSARASMHLLYRKLGVKGRIELLVRELQGARGA